MGGVRFAVRLTVGRASERRAAADSREPIRSAVRNRLVLADRRLDLVGEVVDGVARRPRAAAPAAATRLRLSTDASCALEEHHQRLAGDPQDDQPEEAEDDDLEQAPEPVAEIAAEGPEQMADRPEQERRQARRRRAGARAAARGSCRAGTASGSGRSASGRRGSSSPPVGVRPHSPGAKCCRHAADTSPSAAIAAVGPKRGSKAARSARVDLGHRDEVAEILETRHALVGDAAGHDAVVVAEIGRDVERNAVEGHPARDPDADRRDLVLAARALVGPPHPDADPARAAARRRC